MSAPDLPPLAERVFAEGRTTACLCTDARNPWSNRCYEKIGFRQVCESWFFPRRKDGEPAPGA